MATQFSSAFRGAIMNMVHRAMAASALLVLRVNADNFNFHASGLAKQFDRVPHGCSFRESDVRNQIVALERPPLLPPGFYPFPGVSSAPSRGRLFIPARGAN